MNVSGSKICYCCDTLLNKSDPGVVIYYSVSIKVF